MKDVEIVQTGSDITIIWGDGGALLLTVPNTFPYPESLAAMVTYLLKDKAELLLSAANVDLTQYLPE